MNNPRASNPWHKSLWIAQVVLAAVFGIAGAAKVLLPDAFDAGLGWSATIAPSMLRFIGLMELLGAIGLIAPAATRIAPAVTPLAAGGLTTVMLLASLFHAYRHEPANIAVNIALGLVAGFVAWGRAEKAPIASRSTLPAVRV